MQWSLANETSPAADKSALSMRQQKHRNNAALAALLRTCNTKWRLWGSSLHPFGTEPPSSSLALSLSLSLSLSFSLSFFIYDFIYRGSEGGNDNVTPQGGGELRLLVADTTWPAQL